MVYKRKPIGREVSFDEGLKRVLPNPDLNQKWTNEKYRRPITHVADDPAELERDYKAAAQDLLSAAQAGKIKLYGERVTGSINAGKEKIPPRSCVGARFNGPVSGFTNAAGEIFENVWVSRADLEREYPWANSEAESTNKTGPKPVQRGRVESEMQRDIQTEAVTASELDSMKEEEMVERYKANRETCRKARKAILSKTPTNNDALKIATD